MLPLVLGVGFATLPVFFLFPFINLRDAQWMQRPGGLDQMLTNG